MWQRGLARPGQLREDEEALNFILETLGLVCILLLPQSWDFQQMTLPVSILFIYK